MANRITSLVVCLVLALGIGAGSGLALGFLFAGATWELSLLLGPAIGASVGLLVGAISWADQGHRFEKIGQWLGLVFGLLAAAGCLMWLHFGGRKLTLDRDFEWLWIFAVVAFGGLVGLASGRWGEKVGRSVADV